MTLDQRLSQSARQVLEGLTPPTMDLDVIRARARSDRRRRTFLAAAATLTIVAAAGAGLVASRDTGEPKPVGPITTPVPTPVPTQVENVTSMSPEEVVNDPGAVLRAAGVAP